MKIKAKQMPPCTGVTNGKIYKVLDKYEHGYLITTDDGVADKIHRDNCEVINGHLQAELIMKYAEIAQNDAEPWKHFEWLDSIGRWIELTKDMTFNYIGEYRLKPKTISINGFEVPEPLRSVPAYGTPYFIIDLPHVMSAIWNNHPDEYEWLKAGIIHLTREAAENHLEALLSFTKE